MESDHAALRGIVAGVGPCLVAFSGGVDSTLLLRVAHDVLQDGVTAVTAVSPSLPESERDEAIHLARLIGARHRLVATHEVDDPLYVRNDSQRCYHCKTELFRVLEAVAKEAGGRAIVYGAILDDLGDDRPGMRAAGEAGVRAPLLEAGFTKEKVRSLSRLLGLPTWDKPAMACLASRVPRSMPVTRQALERVERAEASLRAIGYRQVRVRLEGGEGARVELDADGLRRSRSASEAGRIVLAILAAGFATARIDPDGYRPGGVAGPRPPSIP